MWAAIRDFPKLDLSMYQPKPEDPALRFLPVTVDERFVQMRVELPFLADKFSLFVFQPHEQWDVHVDTSRDGSRISTLNIPLYDQPFSSITSFYKFNVENPPPVERLEGKYATYDKKHVDRVSTMSLVKPSVINVSVPHDVVNLEDRVRSVLSWSSCLTWSETADLIQQWADSKKDL